MKLLFLSLAVSFTLPLASQAGTLVVPDPVYELTASGIATGSPTDQWSLHLFFAAPPVQISEIVGGVASASDIFGASFTYNFGPPLSILASNQIISSSLSLAAGSVPGATDRIDLRLAHDSSSGNGVIDLTLLDDSGLLISQDGLLPSGSYDSGGTGLMLIPPPRSLTVQSFSITPVPEPAHGALAAVAVLTFLRRRRPVPA